MFSLSKMSKQAVCELIPQFNRNRDFLLGLTRPGRGAGHSPLSSAEVNHEGSCTSVLPECRGQGQLYLLP